MFWSSVDLTGNQTYIYKMIDMPMFWSSVDLTGNQTMYGSKSGSSLFWSSVDLTGNQTRVRKAKPVLSFGAVSI